ncbi:stage VI sporulation protein D [Halobacillus karajensis]|uniref:Stage VI sporulation protein D n=1 Tax=Halobacillus karajensis TaxID=195088 RepID=A0A024P6Y8_9BACI|nr:LysM peptidoglycan-binding domain-containing protein [Halobacillus karajensis]CDQ18186.1 Stage VI sporulation protein D [Halobacillus karajensis]CDQ24538.1 Stage VI sporulation protein D [Halobacillus karajensis]CDQ29215.1 Stage VI sporulation protein D [Halobacillus karajensis]SEH57630.1 stage VI sporulation protein D [Halobacillus karajensis]
MQNKQNVFSFYLDESIWFKEGQGVRELLGISLEPEITIEELGDEVKMKGTVDLAGEYIPTGSEDAQDESPLSPSMRVMDQVEPSDDGLHTFSHAFPVDITVPLERISSLEDVLIDIESFDYELPANRQLRLHAHVNINGVEEKQQEASNEPAFDETAQVGPVNFPEQGDPKESPVFPEREVPIFRLDDDNNENDEQNEKSEDDGRWFYKKSQSFPEFFGQEQEVKKLPEEPSYDSSVNWGDVSVDDVEESNGEQSSDESAQAPGGMDGIKQIFKHLFPNREDTYTQMKMYIAQEEETLSSIAEKYDVSVKQLERVNDYKDDVSPGQIVYIPN